MKHRRIAFALALLLGATALLSGTLLILHDGHECHQTACPLCTGLIQGLELLRMLAILAGVGLLISMRSLASSCLSENRYLPDWTPVRRKVKLLN
ncbi:MAG: hypothetical protein IJX84_11325 [Clostridia bacterium]|nr:hypothetical protein [Clostridia bacterium]MBQ8615901.1 hypothetical protein [Clostridia bacterium]MBQ8617880.1 hypothetical protein [Clostridia bacterium]